MNTTSELPTLSTDKPRQANCLCGANVTVVTVRGAYPTLGQCNGCDTIFQIVARHELRQAVVDLLPQLRAFAIGFTRNEDAARDLVQDTIERALKHEASYEPGTNPVSWLRVVMFSVFATGKRRRSREYKALDALTNDPCAWTRPSDVSMPEPMSRTLDTLIAKLPPNYRAAIKLDLAGLSYADMGEILGVRTVTAGTRLLRARRQIAAGLATRAA